jgi:hypothetical protein
MNSIKETIEKIDKYIDNPRGSVITVNEIMAYLEGLGEVGKRLRQLTMNRVEERVEKGDLRKIRPGVYEPIGPSRR